MSIRVIVNGAKGKMGLAACDTLSSHKDFDLVARLGKEDNLTQAIADTKAQVVVELTRADCVYANSVAIINQGARPVIGASGLTETQIKELSSLCESKHLGGLIVPNFALGAVLMMMFAQKAAEYLSEVEIIEIHHQQKLDAPSGTAMKTAEMISSARKHPKNSLQLKESVSGARGASYKDVPIHSLRVPGVVAQQQVLFGNTGETLSITHNSIDRLSFMPGIVLSCQKVMTLNHLVYGLENLL